MASSPTEPEPIFFPAADGTRLAYVEMGDVGARPLVLIHGLFSNAWTNWIRYGHAARVVEAGFRLILPDLRGHGRSGAPHDPAAYPPDILADDGEALLAHLGLVDYDLGGYSLGGRTVLRMLARGARPRRAILSGMGLGGILHTAGRGDFFRKVLENFGSNPRGSAEWFSEAFLKTTGGDPKAMIPLLDSFVDTSREALAGIATPVLVLNGAEDQDNGSGEGLAEALPDGRFVAIPGNHMTAVLRHELGAEISSFLLAESLNES
ncbi:alpha/beta fold hydrolase [Sphingomonas sp. BIUV-7]|uniref:Alpha/beta fold hydrolase n=1 Tax=Sphingomonas natans TaxID=3063330 RepID=A0ABT8Y6L5_9SPHN|nr:alpha/beta fold hydrolase [Sphingomonas sp. BIUV-7]MDO6413369.1 alpha/beta fold hydrolase [Sphingomonas sp. BIUV-7]